MANSFEHKDITVTVGDRVLVKQKVQEDQKTRIQIFDGIVMGIKGRQENRSFVVRKIGAGGIGVERIIPIASPNIDSIEVKSRGLVRRAKLNYLRDRTGRLALRVKEDKKTAK
jgi:large subunit ribosomal protein L19